MKRQEWKQLLHNPLLLVVMAAIVVIPTIYSTLFLGSMWDPYGSVEHLPVAVVNLDQPVTVEDTTYDVGQSLVENLKQEPSLDFHFVGQEEARQGLADGVYYMVITIPRDFSQRASSITGAWPQTMELEYETNPGTNYIASKLGESAMKEMELGVREEVTYTYATALLKQLDTLGDGMDQAAHGSGELKDGAHTLAQGAQSLTNYLAQLRDSSLTFVDGSRRLSQGLGEYLAGMSQVAQGSGGLNDGAARLEQGLGQLQAQTAALPQSTQAMAQGARELVHGLEGLSLAIQSGQVNTQQLQALVAQLQQGAGQLQQGLGQLAQQAPAFTQGVQGLYQGAGQLHQGTQALVDGTQQLMDNQAQLTEGMDALTQGSVQIQDAAEQLHQGAQTLTDGAMALTDGMDTLQNKLAQGAQEVADANAGEAVAHQLAAPVEIRGSQLTQVPNNGHAMAPYMMSVALWVGCIAFSLMYPLTSYSGELKSGFAWWRSKASVLYAVAILEALVMLVSLHLFNGLQPVDWGRTVLVALVAALTFMSVMYFFTCLLGKVGSFLMLVFMVLQLSGSVGTYPLELSGPFVPALHSWVPFTYTVRAFRSAMSGGPDITESLAYLAAWLVVFTILTLILFQVRTRRIRRGQSTLMVWLEEHSLA